MTVWRAWGLICIGKGPIRIALGTAGAGRRRRRTLLGRVGLYGMSWSVPISHHAVVACFQTCVTSRGGFELLDDLPLGAAWKGDVLREVMTSVSRLGSIALVSKLSMRGPVRMDQFAPNSARYARTTSASVLGPRRMAPTVSPPWKRCTIGAAWIWASRLWSAVRHVLTSAG